MSKRAANHAGWSEVDSTNDPSFFIRFLDASRGPALSAARADPAGFFAYLDVHPGQHVLDAACGLGELTCLLAGLVGPSGEAVGVDFSMVMVEEARRRAARNDLPVRFEQGDIMALDFPDATFDRARAEQVLQHVSSPETALLELARVTRSGGLIAVMEPDWATLIIDANDLAMSRAFTSYVSTVVVPHGEIGRRLPDLFRTVGLVNVSVSPSVLMPPYPAVREFIESNTRSAVVDGLMPEDEATEWLLDLNTRYVDGRFFAGFTFFQVVGQRSTMNPL